MPDRQPTHIGAPGRATAREASEVALRSQRAQAARSAHSPGGRGRSPSGSASSAGAATSKGPSNKASRGRSKETSDAANAGGEHTGHRSGSAGGSASSAHYVTTPHMSAPWGRRRVLLLNATYEPLTALPVRRAIVLVVCGKAEIVHGDPTGMVLRSATADVEVPSVIRLTNYVRVPYLGHAPLTRAGLMQRDRHRCAYCGDRAETIDHVVPRSRGGAHSWQNCVACCVKCNHRKADKLLGELGWRLRTAPRAPKGMHWRLLADVTETDPLWRPYLGAPAA